MRDDRIEMPRASIVFAAVLFALAVYVMFAAPINTDAAYILVAARRMLTGDRLYIDLIETNPPLAFWMMMPAAAIGSWLKIADEHLVALFATGVLAISGWLGVRVLHLGPIVSRDLRAALLTAFIVALIVPFPEQVAQREMLAAALIFPYTLLAARTITGVAGPRSLRIWCGLLAGIGFAIKPFFLAAWLATEAVVVLRTGIAALRRPETLTLVISQVAYAVSVLTLTPQYVTRMVPMAAEFYGAYGRSRRGIVAASDVRSFTASALLACLSPAWLKTTHEAAAFAQVFGASSLGWMFCFVAQGKGWKYHLLPALVYAAVAVAAMFVLVLEALRTIARDSTALRVRKALLIVPLIVGSVISVPWATEKSNQMIELLEHPYGEDMKAIVEAILSRALGEPIYVMSTNVWPSFPIVNLSGASWPYHYHFLWPIPQLYGARQGSPPYRAPEAQGPREREFFDTVVSDLSRTPPQLLFVERGPYLQAMQGRDFDFVQYFSASAEFRDFLSHYDRMGVIASWQVYQRR